ncbi:MAG: pyrroloquinoline quinone biosynthesis protein PqqE [Acidobacteria bacterium]|nr:MAG: pyrroloquinoline quinone biosynthesis protein PqqE [Acidobacteriota bacterium]
MATPPLALIAELTHRCPLHCVYCSNPLQLRTNSEELPTGVWTQVLEQAAKLGMFHVHLTGGEPLARSDLNSLVSVAHSLQLYTNLITSGIGMNEKKLASLLAAGLDHLQLSFQDAEESSADRVAGVPVHARKVALANLIHECKNLAFTVNLVVHRHNLDRLDSMILFAESLGPQRIEIANVQYYGWALKNREWLLPTREQVQRSVVIVERAQERLKGQVKIDFVTPDYYASFPKPCMGGWGRQLMLVDPSGMVLPCHAAAVIPGIDFENVREKPLSWIWEESASFRRFRGEDWMPEPCRSCDRRALDFGGCRCQAFLITGDAAATDPVCSLAPTRKLIDERLARANSVTNPGYRSAPAPESADPWTYRSQPA